MYAEINAPVPCPYQFMANLDEDFAGTMCVVIAGMVHETTGAEPREWLVTRAEARDPKIGLPVMRDLLGVDMVAVFRRANVPVRCINSDGGYQFFSPRPARPTSSTPTSVRSPSKASATTRCWRSRTS
jgi:hypothetical protein